MGQNFIRNIVYYKRYYLDFFQDQTEAVRLKFNWTLGIIATLERVPEKFFKHIEDGIMKYELKLAVIFFGFSVFLTKGNLLL